jgi:hypothetical protein
MLGVRDVAFMRTAVSVEASARRDGTTLAVTVTIINDGTGHHAPSDSPLRQLILLVDARDGAGEQLPQLSGSTVPPWVGEGDPTDGFYAGLPGAAWAKVLREKWTGVTPTGAYWNQTEIALDNRIPAFGRATVELTFDASQVSDPVVTSRLVFRRAFRQLEAWKSWDNADIEIDRQTVPVAQR